MKKRVLGILMSLVLSLGLLAGCGNGAGETTAPAQDAGAKETQAAAQEQAPETEAPAEIETIKIYCMNMGVASEYQNVVDAINAITGPKIGVEIDLTLLDMGQWFEQYNMLISGAEEIDLIHFFFDNLASGVAQGSFTELTDLYAQYGQDISTYLDESYLSATTIDGGLYAIPVYGYFVANYGFQYNAEIVEELGLEEQVAAVKELKDWEPIMEAVKAAHPEMAAFAPVSGNTVAPYQMPYWDNLGNGFGALNMNDGNLTVVNKYASEDYKEYCELMQSWYEKGYISKDVTTIADAYGTLSKAGTAFSTLATANLGTEQELTNSTGHKTKMQYIFDGTVYANSTGAVVDWGIPATAKHPEAAMKFLNLLYVDQEVATLFAYGVEGENYRTLEDGTIDYLEGEDAMNCKYHPGNQWALPNQYATKVWAGMYSPVIEDITAFNNSGVKSPAMGFNFDAANVQNQITACSNVTAQYCVGLESGSMNVAETLPKFLEALEDAGINDIIAEKQAQLDAWAASK